MNEKNDVARNTKMCTSVVSFIPQGNEKNQQSILKRIRNAQIKVVQIVSISLLSATFSCVLHLWFKRCCCDVVYNEVTRDSIACSLTLRHVTENRYVKYPVHNSWRYESVVLTNRIAGKRMNIKKIKLLWIWILVYISLKNKKKCFYVEVYF